MGYIGNLVSDLKGAASIRGRMYKSVRQTPSFQERGYAFAYNLGTISSLTGLSFGRARGGIYDGLQFQNTVRAALHPTQNSMRSFKNAINIPLNKIDSILSYPKDKKLQLFCAGGYRSVIACSILLKNGYTSLVNVEKGYSGIKKLIS